MRAGYGDMGVGDIYEWGKELEPGRSNLLLLCGMDRHQVREVLMDSGMVSRGITVLQFITVDSRPTTAVLLGTEAPRCAGL
jgi:hypothetical protein